MELTVNGSKRDYSDLETLDQLIDRLDLASAPAGIAVALNDTVIPRDQWAASHLRDGDSVEVIHAVQGG